MNENTNNSGGADSGRAANPAPGSSPDTQSVSPSGASLNTPSNPAPGSSPNPEATNSNPSAAPTPGSASKPAPGKKLLSLLIVILVIVILALVGYLVWAFLMDADDESGENVEESATEESTDDTSDEESAEAEDEEIIDQITWKGYEDESWEGLTFEYPDGADVTKELTNQDSPLCSAGECFDIVIEYEDLTVTLTAVNGIGGNSVTPDEPYEVIYDQSFSWEDPRFTGDISGQTGNYIGLLREETTSGTSKTWAYFPYVAGESEGEIVAPVVAIHWRATFPSAEENDYGDVADYIVMSFYGIE